MYSVYYCLANQHDWRFVLLAACVCAVASFTSFHIYSHYTNRTLKSRNDVRRLLWLVLTGISAGSGIWATHFVAMLAFDPGLPTNFSVFATVCSLAIAMVVTTAGFWVAAREGAHSALIGGCIIGAGIAAMHFVGMQALIVPGKLEWNLGLVAAAVLGGMLLGAMAMQVFRQSERHALWAAPLLLTLAICFLHFTAMGAVNVVYDPTVIVFPNLVEDHTLAFAVAGVATLVMLSAFGAAFINGMAQRDVQDELRRQRDDLQRRKEELRKQNVLFDMALNNMAHGLCMIDAEQRLVVCNRQYAEMYRIPARLTQPGTSILDILQRRVEDGILCEEVLQQFKCESFAPLREPVVRIDELKDGRTIQVTRRPMQNGGSIAIHEDITEQAKLAARLKQQNELLQQRERELNSRNSDLDAALTNMTHGIAMFDAQERLVIANQRYAEIYGMPPEAIRPRCVGSSRIAGATTPAEPSRRSSTQRGG